MRVFLAINLPDKILYEMEAIIEEAKQMNEDKSLKWVKPKSLHLTLHFLDEQNDEAINQITEISKQVSENFKPSKIRAVDWGGFPNIDKPRILFISLKDSDNFINLHDELGQELKKAGFEIDKRPWQTHVTVARNKNPQPIKLDLPKITEGLEWQVKSFELMKSELMPDGAEYEIIKSFKL